MQQRGVRRRVYEEWMEKEGIPAYEGTYAIEDITELPRRPWARLGGKGTFIQLEATKAEGSLLYVAEIAAGGALEPEKHLYNELIYILRGRGLTEVWQEGQSKQTFEWAEGSLFAMPLNAWHRLVNGGRQPVLFLAKTSAPLLMETFRNTDFIFNCPYKFTDQYTGQADYFLASDKRYVEGISGVWETNFVPDVRTAFLDDLFQKVAGGQITAIKMAAWAGCHSSEWPVGMYHKAHYHGPGRVLLGLKSVGYVLLWHKQYGIHPYQDGHGDKVVKMSWKPGSIYSPGDGWFHQHFNTGPESARHLALRDANEGGFGSTERDERGFTGYITVREGGTLIDYEDEDPEIRRVFQEELRENGVKFAMKPVVYHTDSFKLSS